MSFEEDYLYVAAMDVGPDKEVLFNDVYNTEHIPFLTEVPGVLSVACYQREELTMVVGGQSRTVPSESEPQYMALYGLKGPEVLNSRAWAEAVERGRWPEQVRPQTTNRRHDLFRRIYPR